MSIFNYPRINFTGLLMVNVGTANNDDYSSDVFPSSSPYAGQPVRLADSINVQAIMYGMTDSEWIAWAQTQGTFAKPSQSTAVAAKIANSSRSEGGASAAATPTETPVQLIPGEWNYYGDMGLTMMGVNIVGIDDPANVIPASLKTQLQGASLSFNNRPDSTGRTTGMLIDVNPEDPSCSQVFTDFLSLTFNEEFLMSGKPSKASTRWINFQRNANLTGPNGAAATFQCVIPLSELQGQPILTGMPQTSPTGQALAGVVCQYSMFRSMQAINTFKYQGQAWFDAITKLYENKGLNPTYVQLQGTIAPWFEGEMKSVAEGRYLIPTSNTIPVPQGCSANGPALSLAPATLQIDTVNNNIVVNFTASFPELYKGQYDPLSTANNDKYNFGQLSLGISNDGVNQPFADILYSTMVNDGMGWVFIFPFDPTIPGLMEKLESGLFTVSNSQYGILLQETPYMIVSDQSTVFAEQIAAGGSTSSFLDEDGVPVSISFNAYKKGVQLTASDPDTFDLWVYDTTPNQAPGNATLLVSGYKPGQSISLPVGSAGNRLITAVASTDAPPPASYANFPMNYMPIINIRILPNDVDYSQYYVDPTANPPVGNASLTFDVIYNEVLRNYYLLYPAMSQRVPLNDPQYWADPVMARTLLQRISLEYWGRAEAMPRTRDLSQTRRDLLTAWCIKIIQG